jgi:hypothetical protein
MPIAVKDATGATVNIPSPNANGRADADASKPVALSTEDLAAIVALGAKLDALAGFVDSLEGLQGNLATLLTTQNGYVDTLEALVTSGNATLTALAGYVDGLEALAAASLPAGANVVGKFGVDQTTDGVTNKVNVDASLKSSTATRTAVPSTATAGGVEILAANPARKGAIIYNSDANALLLDLSGGVAAANRCQVRLAQHESHEVGAGYAGKITGIWEADGAGQADVVEFA